MPENEIDFEETTVKTQRPDVLIKGDGTVHVLGLRKPFQRHIKNVLGNPKDAIAEAYAFALKGYCVDNGIDRTKESMKQKFLEQG